MHLSVLLRVGTLQKLLACIHAQYGFHLRMVRRSASRRLSASNRSRRSSSSARKVGMGAAGDHARPADASCARLVTAASASNSWRVSPTSLYVAPSGGLGRESQPASTNFPTLPSMQPTIAPLLALLEAVEVRVRVILLGLLRQLRRRRCTRHTPDRDAACAGVLLAALQAVWGDARRGQST